MTDSTTPPSRANEQDADQSWDEVGNLGWQWPSLPTSLSNNRRFRLSFAALAALVLVVALGWLYYSAYGPLPANQKAIFDDFSKAYTLQEAVSSDAYDSGRISAFSDAEYDASIDTIQAYFPDVTRICEDHPNRKWSGGKSSCDALEYWVAGILLGKIDNYQLFSTPARSALNVLPDYSP